MTHVEKFVVDYLTPSEQEIREYVPDLAAAEKRILELLTPKIDKQEVISLDIFDRVILEAHRQVEAVDRILELMNIPRATLNVEKFLIDNRIDIVNIHPAGVWTPSACTVQLGWRPFDLRGGPHNNLIESKQQNLRIMLFRELRFRNPLGGPYPKLD